MLLFVFIPNSFFQINLASFVSSHHFPIRRRRQTSTDQATRNPKVTFSTRHLGPVSAGIIIPPNTINFKAVFANFGAKLLESPVVLSVVLLILCIYIALLIWVRKQDAMDQLKVSIFVIFKYFLYYLFEYQLHYFYRIIFFILQ